MKVILQLATGISARWYAVNPKLHDSVLAVEKTADGKRLFKLGDGITRWQQLPYLNTDNIKEAPGNENSKTLTQVIAGLRISDQELGRHITEVEESLLEKLLEERSRAIAEEERIENGSKSRDAALANAINEEIQNRQNDVDAEETRATNEETRIESESKARDNAETQRATDEEARIEEESKARDTAETERAVHEELRIEDESKERDDEEAAARREADEAHAALTGWRAHRATRFPAPNRHALYGPDRRLHSGARSANGSDVVIHPQWAENRKRIIELEMAADDLFLTEDEHNIMCFEDGSLWAPESPYFLGITYMERVNALIAQAAEMSAKIDAINEILAGMN
ncbi:hypothetical protein AGMMS50212_13540 [Spirochaetia bacterium]|nr:hypothetical protein AGMMS50212_13540 [Spirochaetia bacterium]